MLKITETNRFSKEFKNCIKRGYNHRKLAEIVVMLANRQDLPTKNRNHKLKGEYSGYWECHIEPDWLLIYEVSGNSLNLIRTGTHSDLFD